MESSTLSSLEHIRASKQAALRDEHIAGLPDEIEAFLTCYLGTNVKGIRNEQVAQKIALHLCRFQQFIEEVCDQATSHSSPNRKS